MSLAAWFWDGIQDLLRKDRERRQRIVDGSRHWKRMLRERDCADRHGDACEGHED